MIPQRDVGGLARLLVPAQCLPRRLGQELKDGSLPCPLLEGRSYEARQGALEDFFGLSQPIATAMNRGYITSNYCSLIRALRTSQLDHFAPPPPPSAPNTPAQTSSE